jgi:hypothetical protein
MASEFVEFLLRDCSAIHSLLEEVKKVPPDTDRQSAMSPEVTSFWETPDGKEIDFFMKTMEFNIPLLEEVIISYRFNFQQHIQDLIEIVRMFNILGAEVRYQEYGLVLYDMLNSLEIEQWFRYADRIPVSFERLANKFNVTFISREKHFNEIRHQFIENICALGSKSLLFHISKFASFDPPKVFLKVFLKLFEYNHVELAFEFDYDQYIQNRLQPHDRQIIFEAACSYNRLTVAQLMYGLGNIRNLEKSFAVACFNGHLSICQWLYSLGDVQIHQYEYCALDIACRNGHLHVAKWLLTLDSIDSFNKQVNSQALDHKDIEDWFYEIKYFELFADLNYFFQCICFRASLS